MSSRLEATAGPVTPWPGPPVKAEAAEAVTSENLPENNRVAAWLTFVTSV